MARKRDIHLVREYIGTDNYGFYSHALTEAKKDGVEPDDIVSVVLTGKIIEEYPARNRVLVYGIMQGDCPLHVVCDLSDEQVMYIPTVYIPSEQEWIKYQIRKPKPRQRN